MKKSERPELCKTLDSKLFMSYYYLKEELVAFCKKEGLQSSGSKEMLTKRIAIYLETGEKIKEPTGKKERTIIREQITKDMKIEPHFVCSQVHREFFKTHIGKSFSFNVTFQEWLKTHAGATYEEAIVAYGVIMEEKKHRKTTIDKQFEYNTYIRAFFEDNHGKTLDDAIRCWKYKKGLPGTNKYEASDLCILEDEK